MGCSKNSDKREVYNNTSIPQEIRKTANKQPNLIPVFIPIPKKGNAKECSNYLTIVLISLASKVVLKIIQARLQQ